MRCVLVTGAAGFIGSHTSLVLLNAGYKLFLLDNFSNSSPISLNRVAGLSNLSKKEVKERISIIKGDIRDLSLLERIFSTAKSKGEEITSVIHFAGLKAVGESFEKALDYWETNVGGTLTLLKAMEKNDCRTIVFSSSATVYGQSTKDSLIETDLSEESVEVKGIAGALWTSELKEAWRLKLIGDKDFMPDKYRKAIFTVGALGLVGVGFLVSSPILRHNLQE